MKRQVNTNTKECNECMCTWFRSQSMNFTTMNVESKTHSHISCHKTSTWLLSNELETCSLFVAITGKTTTRHTFVVCASVCVGNFVSNVYHKTSCLNCSLMTHTPTSLCKYMNVVFFIAFFLHSFKLKLSHYNVQVMIAVKVLCACLRVCVFT